MRILILSLTVLLALSAALNSYLYSKVKSLQTQLTPAQSRAIQPNSNIKKDMQQHPLIIAAQVAFEERDAQAALTQLNLIEANLPEQLDATQQGWFEEIRLHLANGTATQQDDEFVKAFLRAYPYNTYFLYLEIEFAHFKHISADTLLDLYQLIRTPMRSDLSAIINARIKEIYQNRTNKLKLVEAWDILSVMLESLVGMAPDDTNMLLDLAEAYAMQEQFTLMDGVLVYLPEDNERVQKLVSLKQERLSPPALDETESMQEYDTAPAGVPLKRAGSHYIVNATLNNKVTTALMIDTGASTSVISRAAFDAIAGQLQPEFIGQYNINTANGLVQAPVYRFERMNIGGFYVNDIAVVVMALEHFSADGLLGMNFLRSFRFEIDQANARLILAPFES